MKEVINGIDCISNKMVRIEIDKDVILSKKYLDSPPKGNVYLGPGLTDLQINGFAGVDFNQFPIAEEGFLNVIAALTKVGVTSFFPTVITNSITSIISLLKNINQLCQQNQVIADFVKGIHLEGPFISLEEGARGAHDYQHIVAPDWQLFQQFQEASGHRIKIITISPEWNNAATFIQKCVKENIVVALGHTIASPQQIRAAVDAGATLSTHLGNGAPLILPRNSNFIFEQLAEDKLMVSLIADGFHLPDSFLKIALKMKPDNAILVSDSTMFAGMNPGIYSSHIGGKVVLNKNGRLSTFENDNILAGSAVSILDCVNKLLRSQLASLDYAWSLASLHPNKLIGFEHKEITDLKTSDLVLFKIEQNTISILKVFKNDKQVY